MSVTPSSGAGSQQTFAFKITDTAGYSHISSAQIDINTPLSPASACYFYVIQSSNVIYLADDSGTWLPPSTIGTSGTLANSQCSLNVGTSSVVKSGNNWTINLALTFKPAYVGTQIIWMEGYNGQDSGWQNVGSWTTSPDTSAPTAVSVLPSGGTGYSGSFAFLSSDPDGGTNITSLQLLFANGSSYANACDFWVDRGSKGIWLRNDANTSWGSSIVAGGSGSLYNSQCTVTAASSSIATSGTNLTVTLAITFTTSFVGTHNITMELLDMGNNHTGPVQRGTWTVGSDTSFPAAGSVTPQNGSGNQQTFAFLSSDADGGTTVSGQQLLFVGSGDGYTNACDFWIDTGSKGIWLRNDANNSWGNPVIAGQSGTLQNSQCSVNAASSSIVANGANLTVTMAISFFSTFAGTHNILMELWDSSNNHTGPVQKGTYTVTGLPDFTIAVSPSSQSVAAGGGASYTVTLTSVSGFSGSVTLTASGLPSGATAGFSPSPVSVPSGGLATSTLNVSTSTNTPGGTSSISVQGTSGSLNHSTSTSLTVSTPAQLLAAFITCVGAGSTATTCTLPTLPAGSYYDVTQTILVGHSNVVVTGGGTMSQTVLVRDPSNTSPMMQVGSTQPVTGVKVQNLTFCGSSTLPNLQPSGVCPSRVSTTCGTQLAGSGPYCVDLSVHNADTGQNPLIPSAIAALTVSRSLMWIWKTQLVTPLPSMETQVLA